MNILTQYLSSELSKFQVEQTFSGMLKFCVNWPIKLSNLIRLRYIALVVVRNTCITYLLYTFVSNFAILPKNLRKGLGWGRGLQLPLFSSQMKISTLLVGRRVNKSCKVTKTAGEDGARIAGKDTSNFQNFPETTTSKKPQWITYSDFDHSLPTSNYTSRALLSDAKCAFSSRINCVTKEIVILNC